MATHLDLEEQEQLDELKAFWNQYGNLHHLGADRRARRLRGLERLERYWQRDAGGAGGRCTTRSSAPRRRRRRRGRQAFADMQERSAAPPTRSRPACWPAGCWPTRARPTPPSAALQWVATTRPTRATRHRAPAAGRPAARREEAYDEALKQQLPPPCPRSSALVADRRGDIYSCRARRTEAQAGVPEGLAGLRRRHRLPRAGRGQADRAGRRRRPGRGGGKRQVMSGARASRRCAAPRPRCARWPCWPAAPAARWLGGTGREAEAARTAGRTPT